MKKILPIIFLMLPLVAFADADGYHDCILDKMPGVANDVSAAQIARLCSQENKREMGELAKKRTGWFDFKSGAECSAKKSKDTPSRVGAGMITAACNAFYEPLSCYTDTWGNFVCQ